MNAISPIEMTPGALDQMMPMNVVIDSRGIVRHIGPTLAKVLPNQKVVGTSFLRAFELRRPRFVDSIEDVCDHAGSKIYLRLRDEHATQLIGTVVMLPGARQVLLNLSFGISVVDAVARYNLAGSDFAPTDLTVEMLFVVEAKSAAQTASGALSSKLLDQKDEAVARAGSDVLTGLANRHALDGVMSRLITRGTPFTLMHLDLDHFKAVNDTMGHAAGDHVLQVVSDILLAETRDGDTVARVGGDEFVLIFPRLLDQTRLMSLARRMISNLEEPISFREGICRISASIGLVGSPLYEAPDADQMLEDADIALYASKNKGRGQATMFQPDMAGGEGHGEDPVRDILSDVAERA